MPTEWLNNTYTQVVDLDSKVQETGGSALATAKELLQERHAARNVETASQVVRQACDICFLDDNGEMVVRSVGLEAYAPDWRDRSVPGL